LAGLLDAKRVDFLLVLEKVEESIDLNEVVTVKIIFYESGKFNSDQGPFWSLEY
jgi:hypothetical protein